MFSSCAAQVMCLIRIELLNIHENERKTFAKHVEKKIRIYHLAQHATHYLFGT